MRKLIFILIALFWTVSAHGMVCMDNTDTLEGGASVNAVVDYVVSGLVGSTYTNLAQGQLSDTDPSVLYTATEDISIVSVVYTNTHSAAVTVNLYLDPTNSGTPRRMIPEDMSLGIGYSLFFDGQRCSVVNASGALVTTFYTTTSAELAGMLSDETGSGFAVFGTSPTFTTQITAPTVIGGTSTTSDLNLKTTTGVGTTGADMHFLVGNNGSTEAMTILNSGYVGIGTTSPGAKTHIYGNSSGALELLRLQNYGATETSGDGSYISFYNLTYPAAEICGVVDTASRDRGRLLFKTANPTMSTRMTITQDGNVGIGTTSPGYELEVAGDIYASGDVSALTFTDRTPYFDGDAVAAIKNIKGTDGEIDHASLPVFAQGSIKQYQKETILGPRVIVKSEDAWEEYTATETTIVKDEKGAPVIEKTETIYKAEDGKITTETKPVYQTVENQVTRKRLKENIQFDEKTGEFYTQESTVEKTVIAETPGRDLGAMISVLTRAVQQLTERIEALEAAEMPIVK